MLLGVLDGDGDFDAVVRRRARQHRLAIRGFADDRVSLGFDDRPERAERRELHQGQDVR
jgi:hypothetical protein